MLLTCCSDADLNYENADPDPTSVFKVLSKPQWLCLYWWLPVQELLLLNIITWLICPHVQFLIQGVVGYLIPTTASQTTAMLFSHASVYGRRGMFNICGPPQFVNHRCEYQKVKYFNAKYLFNTDSDTVKIMTKRDIQQGTLTPIFCVTIFKLLNRTTPLYILNIKVFFSMKKLLLLQHISSLSFSSIWLKVPGSSSRESWDEFLYVYPYDGDCNLRWRNSCKLPTKWHVGALCCPRVPCTKGESNDGTDGVSIECKSEDKIDDHLKLIIEKSHGDNCRSCHAQKFKFILLFYMTLFDKCKTLPMSYLCRMILAMMEIRLKIRWNIVVGHLSITLSFHINFQWSFMEI